MLRVKGSNVCVCFVEVLPLVEFFLDNDITDEEAMQLLESEPPKRKNPDKQDGWRQETTARILKHVQRVKTYVAEIYFTSLHVRACVQKWFLLI